VPVLRHLSVLRGLLVLALGAAAAVALSLGSASGADPAQSLRDTITRNKAQERNLGGAAERLGRLEAATAHEVQILDGRLVEAQAQLGAAQARLDRTQADLQAQRDRLGRLQRRLAQARDQLADVLRERYTANQPDIVTVVLDSHGFADLLERLEFLQRVQESDARVVDVVRSARADAGRQAAALKILEARRQAVAADVASERDGLARMQAVAAQRRAALAAARQARLAALRATRADRLSAQRTLDRLLAERERAAREAGPGGPWAIPWPIVQCESGGQNLPPNAAGASGYYQMLPDTWRGLGGSTPQAYQAAKAEQDRLAAKLWNNGAGASNWVCAALVGAI
jgi:peptidoglycan hydrolase CwlO-like protein